MTTSYANPKLRSYYFSAVDFGATDTTQVIAAPLAGRDDAMGTPPTARGRVRGYTVYNVSEIFAGSTSGAGVTVGDGTTANLYFEDNLGLNGTAVAASVYVVDNGDAVDIPAGATGDITVTFVAGVGTPTGIADVLVDIEWFDV